jgi:hypothetical protein
MRAGCRRLWKSAQIIDHPADPRHMPKHQLAEHKRVHDDLTLIEKMHQLRLGTTEMIDPN